MRRWRFILIIALLSFLGRSEWVQKKAVAVGSGIAFATVSQAAASLGSLSMLFPGQAFFSRECFLFSHLAGNAALHMLTYGFKISHAQDAWHLNRERLSNIPAISQEMSQLLLFLERRYLAKANGFYSAEVDWVCPSFDYSIQVHPESTNCYARDPASKASNTYLKRVEAWKEILPHPLSYPLILTRPFDITPYLPKNVIDLTSLFPEDPKTWMPIWEELRKKLADGPFFYIQRLHEKGVGGIRILPLNELQADSSDLMDWISTFGLSANPLELDRFPILRNSFLAKKSSRAFFFDCNPFLRSWKSDHVEKRLMVHGALYTLKGLLDSMSAAKWEEIQDCPTRSTLVNLSLSQIQGALDNLLDEDDSTPFYQTASHVEEIHNHLVPLLEVLSPFTFDDFQAIYQQRIRSKISPYCTVHASAMTSLAGILRATQPKKILHGENTYFECVHALKLMNQSLSVQDAKESDWDEADLIIAQFNPVLKRGGEHVESYHVEDIRGMLRKAIKPGKSLTLALDATLDYIDSPKMNALIEEFQNEIEEGLLNFICYRSGLKFDLFGMDHFAGAPFFMIHNSDPKWNRFHLLIDDPVLKTDSLSLNWFCLCYKYAFKELEQYRERIFSNTRALLDQIPESFYASNERYRVVPIEEAANAAFIDIKVSGPLHKLRASGLIGGSLYLNSMKQGHPIFYRRSLGFYHPNFGIIFDENYTTIRLTLGLDPGQIHLYADCLKRIDALKNPKEKVRSLTLAE